MPSNNKKPHYIYSKNNITLTLQKHYETLRNCVMLGNRRDKQVREQEDIGVSSAYADDWAK